MSKNEDEIKFKTFDDKVLVKMLEAVRAWVMLKDSDKPMFTFSGPPEVGKSHLLKEVYRLYATYECKFKHHKFGYPEFLYIVWSELTGEALDDPKTLSKIANAGIVFIEDFLSERYFDEDDKYKPIKLNPYLRLSLDFAYRVMNVRVGKATMIDTNRDLKQIEILDERVASRFTRENGIFISIPGTTKRYLSR